jgi:uncharacterized protein
VSAAPTAPGQRLESLDVLRGVALFGVLLENLQHFVVPSYEAYALGPDGGPLDVACLWLVRFACDNKVYLLFSLLFGTGFALQMRQAEAAGARFAPLHVWRMAILFLIGLAHMTWLWDGDILLTYALLGLLLLPLRGLPDRALLAIAALGLLAPSGLVVALAAGADAATLEQVLGSPVYPIRQSSFAFAAFAAGLAAGRRDALSDPAAFTRAGRRWLAPALAVGGLANGAAATLLMHTAQGRLDARGIGIELGAAVGAPCFAFVACWLVMRGLQGEGAARLLRRFAPVGRTTLTNYLLQSLIGVGVLAHTGLGPLGPVTPPSGFLLTGAIFAGQMAASRWWLARFRFGPVEWLWRSATYGALQPLRLEHRA